MRFLKTKIQRAQRCLHLSLTNIPQASDSKVLDQEFENNIKFFKNQNKVQEDERSPASDTVISQNSSEETQKNVVSRHKTPEKNIAINYGKAIANFALSQLAAPYLHDKLGEEGLAREEFLSFIKRKKESIRGISSFRPLLRVEKGDSRKLAAEKRVFQWIAEVFIKYFSVNWIIHGKVSHKMTYLKFRFKMLRRIQHPERFTYIKERAAKH